MASRAQIDRLAQRIEALGSRQSATGIAVIHINVGETDDEAVDRHYRQRPEDREKSKVILVRYVAAKDGRPVEDAR